MIANTRIVLLVSFVFLLALNAAPTFAQGTSSAEVRIDPATVQVANGATTQVAIAVRQVQELYAADIQLSFDPDIVEVQDADPTLPGVQVAAGTFLDPGFAVMNRVDNEAGTVQFVTTQLNPSEPKSGSGTLVVLTLRAKASTGSTPLTLDHVQLATRDGEEITARAAPGEVQILRTSPSGPTNTPIPTQGGGTPLPTFTPETPAATPETEEPTATTEAPTESESPQPTSTLAPTQTTNNPASTVTPGTPATAPQSSATPASSNATRTAAPSGNNPTVASQATSAGAAAQPTSASQPTQSSAPTEASAETVPSVGAEMTPTSLSTPTREQTPSGEQTTSQDALTPSPVSENQEAEATQPAASSDPAATATPTTAALALSNNATPQSEPGGASVPSGSDAETVVAGESMSRGDTTIIIAMALLLVVIAGTGLLIWARPTRK